MSVSLLAFIVSGVSIVIFFLLRYAQRRLGLLLFWPDARARLEKVLQGYFRKAEDFSRTFNKRTVYIILHFVLVKIRALFVFLQHTIDKRLVRLVNLIKGRHMTEMKGNASHFLHDINRFKNKFRRQ